MRFGLTVAHTQVSAYISHCVNNEALYDSISAGGSLLHGLPVLELDMHHLHPPGVGHLLLSLCPTGDLGEKATLHSWLMADSLVRADERCDNWMQN